jgi:hypothetical protein
MSTFEHTVRARLSASPEAVFAVLDAWRQYPAWWSLPVSLTRSPDGGQRLVVSPLPLVRIHLSWLASRAHREVIFDYVGGPFRGQGAWNIAPATGGGTRLSYTVRLESRFPLGPAVSHARWLRRKHVRDIHTILSDLAAHLRQRSSVSECIANGRS